MTLHPPDSRHTLKLLNPRPALTALSACKEKPTLNAREGTVAAPASNAPEADDSVVTRFVDRLIDEQSDLHAATLARGQGLVG